MASRWLNLLLGVALLQGALSFGPIDETDEEWIEYRNLLRNGAYRLSRDTRPINYQVHLTPHLASGDNQFTFDGEVTITIEPLVASRNQIELHCNDLTIEDVFVAVSTAPNVNITTAGQTYTCDEYSKFRINTTPFLLLNQQYIVRIIFKGNLQTNMRGFYRSWYNDATGTRRWMATTQFQPGHARQAFPCYDEPWYKATFDISITRDIEGFSPTISNMPIASSDATVGNGKIRENFYRTPSTSTYLLAFIVSDYRQVATNNNDARPFHIYARENIGNTGAYSLAIGVPLLDVMERYTNYPYYSMATNMNMKQAAIPDFSAGAMENWGLLTYREALILHDPENTNNFYQQRIANIISHEIAHMWFGNLVTCDWWDNLWLNEGFARFYQYYLTAIVSPEMGFETRFITEQVQVSLLSDSALTAHPLTDPTVSDPTGVSAHFSQITYGKGASVLRMTQHLLGNDTYVTGLRNYLSTNRFSTAEPSDLFLALQNAATASGALTQYTGVTISQYFSTWTDKPGHPLLTVTVNHETGNMNVQQSRFFFAANPPANNDLWDIPITWTRGGAPDFEDLKPSQIMRLGEVNIPRVSLGREWVIFNKQQSGFYRVNYDELTWALITQALRGSDRLLIHEYNRAQIVDDVFLLARANILTYTRAFNIISFLKFEDQYAPWLAAITGFNFALRRLAHGNFAQSRLRNEIIDLSTAVVARLGYNETENSGTFMDNLLRMHVMSFLCNVGDQGCITAARANFQAWRNGGRIPPNMRPWVYCNGLRYGTSQDYDFFWNQYLGTNLANEQVVMITAAGCTQDQPSLNRFLANIASGSVDNFIIRPQDYSTAVSSAVTSNEPNTMRVFQWLQGNLQRVIATPGLLNTMLTSITNRLLTDAEITAVETWLTANREVIGDSAFSAGNTGVANSRSNLQFYVARVNEFDAYFDTGFDDPFEITTVAPDTTPTVAETPTTTIEPTTSTTVAPTTPDTTTTEAPTTAAPTAPTDAPTAAPTTVEPTTTPVPDSANIATLSFVTLIVTLVINMA